MSFLDELLDHSGRQELQRLQSRQRTSLKRSSDAPLPEHKDQCSTTGARTARQELREIRSRSIMRLESCWIGVIALAMVVTGQGCTKLDAPRADADLRAARQACDAQYPRQVGQYVAHARCVNEAIDRIALPISEHPDLVKRQQATRMELSIRVDRREISPEDAALVMAAARCREPSA